MRTSTKTNTSLSIPMMKKKKQGDDPAAGNDIENDESYTDNFDNYVLNEVAIMQSLSEYGRKYVVQVIDFYEEPDYFYVVMDLMNGGDVLDRLYQRTKYTEEDAKQLIKRLLEAVACMHSLGIAHRDLKPQNLLLTVCNPNTTMLVQWNITSCICSQILMLGITILVPSSPKTITLL